MPIYSVQGPDGRIYDVEGPAGASEADIVQAVRRQYLMAPAAAQPTEDKQGFMAGIRSGIENLKGDVGALGAGLGIEGGEAYARAQAAKAAELYQQPKFSEAPVDYVTGMLGQSLPYIAAPLAAGAAAAAAPLTGTAALTASLGAAGLASATQFTGSNLSRQLDEGRTTDTLELGNAALAAIPQAALDTLSLKLLPGIGRIFGTAGKELTEEAAQAAARAALAQGTGNLVKQYGGAVVKTAGIEGLTETGQQVLERMQAELEMMDPEARGEYLDSFIGGALLGGTLAAPGKAFERGADRRKLAEFDKRKAAEEAAKTAQERAEYEKTDEYALEVATTYENARTQLAELEGQKRKAKKGSPTFDEDVAHNKAIGEQQKALREETNFKDLAEKYKALGPRLAGIEASRFTEAERAAPTADKLYMQSPQATIPGLDVAEDAEADAEIAVPERLMQQRQYLDRLLTDNQERMSAAAASADVNAIKTLQQQRGLIRADMGAIDERLKASGFVDTAGQAQQLQQDIARAQQQLQKMAGPGFDPDKAAKIIERIEKAQAQLAEFGGDQQVLDMGAPRKLSDPVAEAAKFDTERTKRDLEDRQNLLQQQRVTPEGQPDMFAESMEEVETQRREGETNFDYLDDIFEKAFNQETPGVTPPEGVTFSEKAQSVLDRLDAFDERIAATEKDKERQDLQGQRAALASVADSDSSVKAVYDARNQAEEALLELEDVIDDFRTGTFFGGENVGAASTTPKGLNRRAEAAKQAYIRAVLQEAAAMRTIRGEPAITTDEALKAADRINTELEELIVRGQAQRGEQSGIVIEKRANEATEVYNAREDVQRAANQVEETRKQMQAAAQERNEKKQATLEKQLADRMLELERVKNIYKEMPKRLSKGAFSPRIGEVRPLEERPFGKYRAALGTIMDSVERIRRSLTRPEAMKPRSSKPLLTTQFAETEAKRVAEERGETATTLSGELRRRAEFVRNKMGRIKGPLRPIARDALNKVADIIDSGKPTRDLLDATEAVVDVILSGQRPYERDVRAINDALAATQETPSEQRDLFTDPQERAQRKKVEGVVFPTAERFENSPIIKYARAAVDKARGAQDDFRKTLQKFKDDRRREAIAKEDKRQLDRLKKENRLRNQIKDQREDYVAEIERAQNEVRDSMQAAKMVLAEPKLKAAQAAIEKAQKDLVYQQQRMGLYADEVQSPEGQRVMRRIKKAQKELAAAQTQLDVLIVEATSPVDESLVQEKAAHDDNVQFERAVLDKIVEQLQKFQAANNAQVVRGERDQDFFNEQERIARAAEAQRVLVARVEAAERTASEKASRLRAEFKERLARGLDLPSFNTADLPSRSALRARIDALETTIEQPSADVLALQTRLEEQQAEPKDRNRARRIRYTTNALELAQEKHAAQQEELQNVLRELKTKLGAHQTLTAQQRAEAKAEQEALRLRTVSFDAVAALGVDRTKRATGPASREQSAAPAQLRTGSAESISGESRDRADGRITESRQPVSSKKAVSAADLATANRVSQATPIKNRAAGASAAQAATVRAAEESVVRIRKAIEDKKDELRFASRESPVGLKGTADIRVELAALEDSLNTELERLESVKSQYAADMLRKKTPAQKRKEAEEAAAVSRELDKELEKYAKDYEDQGLFDTDFDDTVLEGPDATVPDTLPEKALVRMPGFKTLLTRDNKGDQIAVQQTREEALAAARARATRAKPATKENVKDALTVLRDVAGQPFDTTDAMNGKTMVEVARLFEKRSQTAWRKQVFAAIADALEALPVTEAQGRVFITAAKMRGRGGFYLPEEGAIVLGPNSKAEIVLHELVHAASSNALRADSNFFKRVDALREKAADWFETKEGKAFHRKYGTYLFSKDASLRAYGLKNPHEFLAEAMSNRYFQMALASIPTDKPVAKNLFKNFVDILAQFFGLDKAGQKTVLAEAVALTGEIFDFTKAHINKYEALPKARASAKRTEVLEGMTGDSATDKQGLLERTAAIMRGVFPDHKPEFNANVPASFRNGVMPTAAETTFGDKLSAFMLGMRTKAADQYAAREALLKLGLEGKKLDEAAVTQSRIYMRLNSDANRFSHQAMLDAPLALVKDEKGFFGVGVDEKRPGYAKVLETLRGVVGEVGNMEATEGLFQRMLQIERAETDGVGFDKMNMRKPPTAAEVRQFRADLAANPELKAAFDKARTQYREYNNGMLDFVRDAGAFTDKEVAAFKKGNYVPYYRLNENTGNIDVVVGGTSRTIGNVINQPQLKELVGGEKDFLSLSESVLQNTQMLTRIALQNLQARDVGFMIQNLGLGKIIDGDGPANSIRFKLDGEKKWVKLDTDLFPKDIPAEILLQGLHGVKAAVPAALKMAGIPTNFLRATIVRMPLYIIRQMIRDPLHAWFTTGQKFTPVVDSIKELTKMYRGESDTELKLLRSGAVSSNVMTGDYNDAARTLRDMSAEGKPWNTIMATLDNAALRADASTRAVLYDKYRQQGMSHFEAALGAAEVMNFTRRGTSSSLYMMSTLVPFFNAQIQGIDSIYRGVKGDTVFEKQLGVRNTLAKRAALMTGITLAYALAMQDDEAYKNATPQERAMNWFLPLPFTDAALRVPIPFEIGILTKAIPELLYNAGFGDASSGDTVKGLKYVLGMSVPSVIPTAAKPILEIATNYSFFRDGPIETLRDKQVAPEFRYRESTTELAKLMGKVGVSPLQIEHFVTGYASTAGLLALSMFNPILRPFTSEERGEKVDRRITETPFFGSAFQPSTGRGLVDSVYADVEDWQQAAGTFKNLVASGRTAEARAFADKQSRDIALSSTGGSFRNAMGQLAEVRRSIEANPNMTGSEKRERIEEIKKLQIKLAAKIREMSAVE